jgi:hydrogenase maturation factor
MAGETKNTEEAGWTGRPFRIIEVCGMHKAVIYRSGLRIILPENMKFISAPLT